MTAAFAVLPEHLHGALWGEPEEVRERLGHVLANHTAQFGGCRQGWDVAVPRLVDSAAILRRTARYIDLNAARAGLVSDPLCWPLCTLRDVVGAIADPWVEARQLARWTRSPGHHPDRSYHAFVQRAYRPAAFPEPWLAGTPAAIPVTALARACAAALRTTEDAIQRRGDTRLLFVHLAQACGPISPAALAKACGTTTRTIYNLRNRPPPPGLPAALLCLGDPRLGPLPIR